MKLFNLLILNNKGGKFAIVDIKKRIRGLHKRQ